MSSLDGRNTKKKPANTKKKHGRTKCVKPHSDNLFGTLDPRDDDVTVELPISTLSRILKVTQFNRNVNVTCQNHYLSDCPPSWGCIEAMWMCTFNEPPIAAAAAAAKIP